VTIAALAGVATAAHVDCSAAKVLVNLVTVNSTFATTIAENPVDPLFQTACGANFYRDFYYKYTATCNGVGLVSLQGNENVTRVRLGVFTGTCAAPVQAGISSTSNRYAATDMTPIDCTSPSFEGSAAIRVQNSQFIAVMDTEYIISIGSLSDTNFTGNGDSFFDLNVGCAAPASNDPAAATPVLEGTSVFSNIDGAVAGVRPSGCQSNAVYMDYTATCTGSVIFSFVPPPCSGACDGFHGEDLKIGLYEGVLTDDDVCQDDPAYIYANATAADDWSPPGGGGFLKGGVTSGTKYTVVGASYSSAKSPFVLLISPCEGDTGAASTVGVSMAALVAWMVL
jgi:hypothetical protein